MTKAKLLQPDLILGDTVLHLSADILRAHQLRGLVLDVDETLVPMKESFVSDELRAWVTEVRQFTSICLVSNNISVNRIGNIAQKLDVPFFYGAAKPSRRKLRKALAMMDLPTSQVAMVGDRLFTDVLAGNRLGMFTILVEPMVDSAIAVRSYPLRNIEVWISQQLGVSLKNSQHKVTKKDNS